MKVTVVFPFLSVLGDGSITIFPSGLTFNSTFFPLNGNPSSLNSITPMDIRPPVSVLLPILIFIVDFVGETAVSTNFTETEPNVPLLVIAEI